MVVILGQTFLSTLIETFGARPLQQILPAREPADATGAGLQGAGDAGENAFAIETEHRLQVGSPRCRLNRGLQVVEHQRFSAGLRVVGKDHVCLLDLAGAGTQPRLHVNQAHPGDRHAGQTQE